MASIFDDPTTNHQPYTTLDEVRADLQALANFYAGLPDDPNDVPEDAREAINQQYRNAALGITHRLAHTFSPEQSEAMLRALDYAQNATAPSAASVLDALKEKIRDVFPNAVIADMTIAVPREQREDGNGHGKLRPKGPTIR